MRLSWLVVCGLAACSPYSYPKEVSAISTGVTQISDGFTSGYAALASDRAAQLQLGLIDARARVIVPTSCGHPNSEVPCELYQFGGPAPAQTVIELDQKKTTAVLAVLKDYADALAAVTNAANRTAYDAAVAQLSGAVGALAKNADPAAPGVGTVAPALINIFGWVVGTALDQQRFESLKAGVTAASTPQTNGKVPFDTVVTVVGDGLLALSLTRQASLSDELDALVKPLGPSMTQAAYQQRLNEAQAVVAVLDGLRKTNPTAATAALIKAHAALVAAVSDPSRGYPNLLTVVNTFATEAASLRTVLTARTTPPSAAAQKGS
jgi:hypothetical protein